MPFMAIQLVLLSFKANMTSIIPKEKGRSRVTSEEVARHAGTIPYELFCSLGERVERRVRGRGGCCGKVRADVEHQFIGARHEVVAGKQRCIRAPVGVCDVFTQQRARASRTKKLQCNIVPGLT